MSWLSDMGGEKSKPENDARMAARNPSGRMGEVQDAAEAVIWLCSDAASFMLGHTLVVDVVYWPSNVQQK
jgi:NAD(P)-dependent dehydrogenase (short-subunit alcohol dehydrogenase family)